MFALWFLMLSRVSAVNPAKRVATRSVHICDDTFFKACRSGIVTVNSDAEITAHDSKITKIICGDRIEEYLLPKTIDRWPTFRAVKQQDKPCPNIYFKRVGGSHSC